MKEEIVRKPTAYFRPFPAWDDVFDDRMKPFSPFLLPLATVSLSHFDSTLSGDVHFVLPIDYSCSEIGANTAAHHTYYCRENWIGFLVNDSSKFQILCELKFFVPKDVSGSPDGTYYDADYFDRTHADYVTERKTFTEKGAVFGKYSQTPIEYAYLGGHPGWPNYSSDRSFPYLDQPFVGEDGEPDSDYIPVAEDGTPFIFVGWLHAFAYTYAAPCSVYLFYHPRLRIALEAFDWS